MQLVNSQIEKYAETFTSDESEILRGVRETTHKSLKYDQMLSGKLAGRFLRLLVRISGARRVLEIGMFTGYSALSMAEALPEGGLLITCDTNERYAELARKSFEQSPEGGKIIVKMGDALATLESFSDPFDLIFLDADKNNYLKYYQKVKPLLKKGGLLVIDNAFWGGDVLKPHDAKAQTIHRLNKVIHEDPDVENVLLPVRDGMNLVQKIR